MADSSHRELSTFRGIKSVGSKNRTGFADALLTGARGIPLLGGRQAGKAPGFGPGIRRFESFPPSHREPGAGERAIRNCQRPARVIIGAGIRA